MSQKAIHETALVLERPDGARLAAYKWTLGAKPRGVVVIAHGMGEHVRRYPPKLTTLLESGIGLYGVDHRGHGGSIALNGGEVGDFGPGGLPALVEDLAALVTLARAENAGLPVVLLGHSMGSFIAQCFVLYHAGLIDGLVLSGTSALDSMAAAMQREPDVVGALNRAFEPARTPFDWLSRDPAEVDAYIADPFCGFVLTMESMISMLSQAERLADPQILAGIPGGLPIYILEGDADPLFSGLGDLGPLLERYRAAGLAPVLSLYKQGRHEMLNEINNAEVQRDLLGWLDKNIF